jgi:potassium-transporting ATPase KdpC subunit
MKTQSVIALKFFIVMTILTGIIYPLVMTGIAQIAYPSKSNGSLIMRNGKVIGSELIGQRFDSSIYFWSRPSFIGYNPVPSGASNWGPTSDTLKKLTELRRETFAKMNSLTDLSSIPKEMIFASASGLDPHISPEAALMQVERISEARHFSSGEKEKLMEILNDMTEKPQFYCLGQPRINVLILNIELDKIKESLTNNK